MGNGNKIEDVNGLLRLWYHESCRIFQDRLVNAEDREWFEELMRGKMKSEFGAKPEEVLPNDTILYGDFMVANVDNKQYAFIEDHSKVCQKTYLLEVVIFYFFGASDSFIVTCIIIFSH